MVFKNQTWVLVALISVIVGVTMNLNGVMSRPYRILLDTDVDTDDFFALLYLLKLNRSEFNLKGVTINSNGWTNAGHAVNHVYDMLYMMGRDDIPVGVGGEGGITQDGTILPNVGGFLPLIEQGMTTSGYCRYRQAIPVGPRGKLDIDTNFGIRKAFLPQGTRRYIPLEQPTVQQVMMDVISQGPTTVFLIGAHTNLAVFLMSNPQLKKNVEHIYVMGGGIRANNPDCCRGKPSLTCQPALCSDLGNMYTAFATNPYAEYNIFGDPFAAYQVLHSGIPVTLIPLDATNTIPITKNFLHALEHNQRTYEAQYCFKSLHMARDTWFNDQFYQSYFMWDSFTAGVAASIMSNNNPCGKNEFADMEYMNITVITSNEPYGVSDGSNPFFDGQQTPRFHLKRGGVHSGHVQTGLEDPFCLVEHGRGRCEDGYTKEVVGSEAVRVLVAMRAKPNRDPRSQFNTEFLNSFLEVINRPQQSGRFNITTQFPYHKQILYKPNFGSRKLGKPVVFDMDMDAGDFLALFYLLKVPVEELDLKAVFVTPTGWASAATIDVVYDLLHMMGRDDIPVGLGDFFAMNQSSSGSAVGDCKYSKAIPLGSGGLLDSDTLYGLARNLPKSPRRYTAENSLRYGAPRNTEHPEFRQPQALDIWEKIKRTEDPKTKFTILTSGPLTTLAKIVLSDKDASSFIQDVFIVGGNVDYATERSGNTFSIDSNSYAELNMFLDPVAAKSVFESELNITLIPLGVQRKVNSFTEVMNKLYETKKTPEVRFAKRLLSRLQHLQKQNHRYQHMDIFLGQILGPVILAEEKSLLSSEFKVKPISIIAVGNESVDGQMEIDETNGKRVKVIEEVDQTAYYGSFASRLGDEKQSAVLGSFSLQKKLWSTPRRHPTKE